MIVPTKDLEESIREKVNNTHLYTKLKSDPRSDTHSKLFKLWVDGKASKFVSGNEAKTVMGVTENNSKSTSSIYKFGTSYFTPSLKIHKLDPADLKPGCKIPARLILAAQDEVTKRSDVFVQQR